MPRSQKPKPPPPEPLETRMGIITGWRCWTVIGDECLLRPIYKRGLIWKPRQPYEAFCAKSDDGTVNGRPAVHVVPHQSCKCGIWAVCHPMLLNEVEWDWNTDEVLVVGQVALWGNIIEHERGWRGQFGYPTHLYAFTEDDHVARTLRERYAVPVASGREATLLEKILPPALKTRPPAGGPGDPAQASEMPTVPFGLAGVVEMVSSQEADRLGRLREDLRRELARVEEERQAIELERQRKAAEAQRHALERRRLGEVGKIERLTIRFTPADWRALEEAAWQRRLNVSTFARECCLRVLASMQQQDSAFAHPVAGGQGTSQRVTEIAMSYARVHGRLRELGWSQSELARRVNTSLDFHARSAD